MNLIVIVLGKNSIFVIKKMNKELILSQITASVLRISDDDRGSLRIKGFYKNSALATKDSIGASWFGSDGKVESVELYTDGYNIYNVSLAGNGKFVDEERKYTEEMIDSIRKKLNKDELEFLRI